MGAAELEGFSVSEVSLRTSAAVEYARPKGATPHVNLVGRASLRALISVLWARVGALQAAPIHSTVCRLPIGETADSQSALPDGPVLSPHCTRTWP